MALARARRSHRQVDYWPGFVDALSVMLLVITFLLSVFMLSQFYMSREVTGKDSALSRLNRQIEELTSLLALERSKSTSDQSSLASLQSTLDATTKERNRLQGVIDAGVLAGASEAAQASSETAAVAKEKDNTARAFAQIDILNQQISALRKQLSALEDALGASESRDKESQARIAELGSRLNVALAQKVQELARYRSDFFGRLREILGNRPGIRVVGDRFVFQSEVLFDSGQATMSPDGRAGMDQLAAAIIDLEREIPPDIPWILRVDGHTDKRPITSPQFKSNWDLSASRAIAVVQYLVTKGVDPQRLLAAGFGEFQPIDPGDSEEALRRNRRIELKLTER
ncbi:peptidoglycan -binding protein [Lichenifustis flavocetrariae]|uniref:Peptidoglycan -binding protein n=1 Tax=Lichenifustis flavocetrariae TaxID=2949735 RepID=A0AA41YTE5_9HYPH|nr:peptidoglycan -binding protein [Lichenifustis flavocetrariae]MCW6506881.1 peptidoglycan -binding protein [Lichenifustis flavocetrariae]